MLTEIRKQIDAIDKEIADLFRKRIDLVKQVIAYKKENNLPILDQNRENQMILNNKANVKEEYQDYYIKLLITLMSVSKELQNELK